MVASCTSTSPVNPTATRSSSSTRWATTRSIDKSSRRELLFVEQPYSNHNGGQLVVGPDGFLYIGLGDGGDGGDPHGHGQDTSTLLGSILRIDPEEGSEDGPAYAIPPGNPFADGEDGAPETWLYGVRNPWRFTFDTANGDLWVADVGQNEWEEINRLPAVNGFEAGRGANLGWNEMEGTHSFDGGENPAGGVLPIFEYDHDAGLLHHRRLRLPGRGHPGARRRLPVRGLLRGGRQRHPGRRRRGDRLAHVGPARADLLVRPRRRRRAVPARRERPRAQAHGPRSRGRRDGEPPSRWRSSTWPHRSSGPTRRRPG